MLRTARAARARWRPVWVVVDGSTDGTDAALRREAAADPGLRVLVLPQNRGKGAALLHGLEAARAAACAAASTAPPEVWTRPAATIRVSSSSRPGATTANCSAADPVSWSPNRAAARRRRLIG